MPEETREYLFRIRVKAPVRLNSEEVAGLLDTMLAVGIADAADSCDEEFEGMAELAELATSLDFGPFELEEKGCL